MKLLYDKLIVRRRKVVLVDEDEVLSGSWLLWLKKERKGDEKFEFEFKNGYLTIVFYDIKTRGGKNVREGRGEIAEVDESN